MTAWRTIPGFPSYQVSDAGVVRQQNTGRGCQAGAIKSPQTGRRGYLQVTLYLDGKGYRRFVHRLVCEAFNGPPPCPEALALHKDDRKLNNTPGNLRWGSHQDNMQDRTKNGRKPMGEMCGHRTLSAKDVKSIRSRAKESRKRLADEFSVHPQTITDVISRKTWRHL